MNEPTIVTRRRALALLAAVPAALVALPSVLDAAPVATSADDVRAARLAAWDSILEHTRPWAEHRGPGSGDVWLHGLARVAVDADAYAAEQGPWARPVWQAVAGEYLAVVRRCIDEHKARQAAVMA